MQNFKLHSFCSKNIGLGNSWVKAMLGNGCKSDFTEQKLSTLNLILITNLTSAFLTKFLFLI